MPNGQHVQNLDADLDAVHCQKEIFPYRLTTLLLSCLKRQARCQHAIAQKHTIAWCLFDSISESIGACDDCYCTWWVVSYTLMSVHGHIAPKVVTEKMYHCRQLTLEWSSTATWGCYCNNLWIAQSAWSTVSRLYKLSAHDALDAGSCRSCQHMLCAS